MSAIRARTLDILLDFITHPGPEPGLGHAVDTYRYACSKAPRLVLAWHHIRMGLRVLTTGKALP